MLDSFKYMNRLQCRMWCIDMKLRSFTGNGYGIDIYQIGETALDDKLL